MITEKYMSEEEYDAFEKFLNRKGIELIQVGDYIPFKKQYFEEIKEIIYQQWAESLEEMDIVENISTMKELKYLIVDENIMGEDFMIWRGHFVNSVTS